MLRWLASGWCTQPFTREHEYMMHDIQLTVSWLLVCSGSTFQLPIDRIAVWTNMTPRLGFQLI